MVVVRHRTASGRLDALWEFDPARKVVELVLRLASEKPRAFTVAVCFPDRPRIWAHPLMRLDSESWRILPSLFVPIEEEEEVGVEERHGVPFPRARPLLLEPWECRRAYRGLPCPLHAEIGTGSHLVLTNAPANVEIELAELSL